MGTRKQSSPNIIGSKGLVSSNKYSKYKYPKQIQITQSDDVDDTIKAVMYKGPKTIKFQKKLAGKGLVSSVPPPALRC